MTYPLSWKLALKLFAIFVREVKGLENVPQEPVIFVGNHNGYLDAPIVLKYVLEQQNKKVHGVAFPIWFSFLYMKWFENIRVGGAVQKAVDYLKKGESILIFPEGRRNDTDTIFNYKTGAITIAMLSGKRIVPFGLRETTKFPWIRKTRLIFRKQIKFKKFNGRRIPRHVLLTKINSTMKVIAKLSKKRLVCQII